MKDGIDSLSSGWGSTSYLDIGPYDAAAPPPPREVPTLGQFTASAVTGNAVLGSVFYAIPAVVAVSGV